MVPGPHLGSGDLFGGRRLSAGRYVIQAKLAQGGMSAIYKAQDGRLSNRVVAIKEMNELTIEPTERPQVLDSFKREAEILSGLDHPNLVKVFDLFEEDGRHYMIMEFIPGRALLEILEEEGPGGLPEDRVLAWAGQLCDVLAYLHSQQPKKIIYRDLKPGNVMELTGTTRVKLIDFGIARLYKPGKRKDTIDFGTPGYAAPEQYGTGQTDERSDIYSLGATLHHLLTGHDPSSKPFNFPSVRSLNGRVSQQVNDAIARAVAVRREERFSSMMEMKVALLGGAIPNSRPPPITSSAAPAKPAAKSKSRAKAKPKPAGDKLSLSQTHLDFGQVLKGQHPIRIFSVIGGGAGARVSTDQPWLVVQPVLLNRDQADVQLRLRSELMSLGRKQWPVPPRDEGLLNQAIELVLQIAMVHARFIVPVPQSHRGKVSVRGKGGDNLDVDVAVNLTPQTWHVVLGWLGVVGAMSLEVLLTGLIAGAMLAGCA